MLTLSGETSSEPLFRTTGEADPPHRDYRHQEKAATKVFIRLFCCSCENNKLNAEVNLSSCKSAPTVCSARVVCEEREEGEEAL